MSTFKGQLVDPALSFIAIDHFREGVYNCEMFLLSHHHTDHMEGLTDFEFCKLVNDSPTKALYCSPITANFLKRNARCSIRDSKIVPMEIDKPLEIVHQYSKTDINITCLPAAHCPGSVMFLIEYEGKRILYSGDIRLTEKDLKNLVGTLTNRDGSIIQIDDLYLDTTFAFSSQFEDFPSREDSELTIIDLVKQSLTVSSERRVVIKVVAKFGYENLFIKLRKAFRTPIVMHEDMMTFYEGIEEIHDYIISSADDRNWLIHACLNPFHCNLVRMARNTHIIKPCVYGFATNYSNNAEKYSYSKWKVPFEGTPNVTKVLYSTHCSLNELRRFYAYLKPKRVIPTVIEQGRSFGGILSLIGANTETSSRGLQVLPSQGLSDQERERRAEIRKELGLN